MWTWSAERTCVGSSVTRRWPYLFNRLRSTCFQRLESRGTDAPERIEERLAKAQWELEQHVYFDKVLINDDLAAAQAQALEWLKVYTGNPLSA